MKKENIKMELEAKLSHTAYNFEVLEVNKLSYNIYDAILNSQNDDEKPFLIRLIFVEEYEFFFNEVPNGQRKVYIANNTFERNILNLKEEE